MIQPYLLIDVTLLWAAAPSGSSAPLAQLKGKNNWMWGQMRWQHHEKAQRKCPTFGQYGWYGIHRWAAYKLVMNWVFRLPWGTSLG